MAKSQDTLHLQTIHVDGGTYEQKYTLCSKPNCWCSNPQPTQSRPLPGHGPYWYRLFKSGNKVRRRYIGKDLVTSKALLPEPPSKLPPLAAPNPSSPTVREEERLS